MQADKQGDEAIVSEEKDHKSDESDGYVALRKGAGHGNLIQFNSRV